MYYISSTFVPSTYYESENKCNEYPKQDILYVSSFQYIFIILKKNWDYSNLYRAMLHKYKKLKIWLKTKKSAKFLVFFTNCILLSNKNRISNFYMIRTTFAP